MGGHGKGVLGVVLLNKGTKLEVLRVEDLDYVEHLLDEDFFPAAIDYVGRVFEKGVCVCARACVRVHVLAEMSFTALLASFIADSHLSLVLLACILFLSFLILSSSCGVHLFLSLLRSA